MHSMFLHSVIFCNQGPLDEVIMILLLGFIIKLINYCLIPDSASQVYDFWSFIFLSQLVSLLYWTYENHQYEYT